MTSKTGKKAIGEGLDALAADMQEEKEKKTPRAKPKAKPQARPQKDDESKKLQKDIKALLIRNSFFQFVTSHLVGEGCLLSQGSAKRVKRPVSLQST